MPRSGNSAHRAAAMVVARPACKPPERVLPRHWSPANRDGFNPDLIAMTRGGKRRRRTSGRHGSRARTMGGQMNGTVIAQGTVTPFDGMDVPWLLKLRSESRRDHPFLIWAPFDAPARRWTYGEFHDRVGALAAGLAKRGVRPGDAVLIHIDNCVEAMLAWFACVELGALAVTTNTRSAAAEMSYFAGHCGAVAAITQPAYAQMISADCRDIRWIAVIGHDPGEPESTTIAHGDSFESL